MKSDDRTSVRALAETTDRANYLAYEVFVAGQTLLPTGRTIPIVAESRRDAGSQLATELRAWGERPWGAGPVTFWVSEHRYWLVDKAETFPTAPADIDGIWLHYL